MAYRLLHIQMHFITSAKSFTKKNSIGILDCLLHFSDYIVVPKSQEDDIHNVQSVIDSLALDYLQISLSHITGADLRYCRGCISVCIGVQQYNSLLIRFTILILMYLILILMKKNFWLKRLLFLNLFLDRKHCKTMCIFACIKQNKSDIAMNRRVM